MADHLTLLGALVATQNLTVDDAILLANYLEYVDEIGVEPVSVMSAVDLALDYLRPSPDEDAAAEAAAVAEHDSGTCADCGGDLMDEADWDQALDLWQAVRGIADKYAFDREYHEGGRGEPEEC